MQVIWSRAAQTRPCRCGPCLNAVSAVGRRSTTATAKRRLKAGDIFTACYTAMFATAALADAKFKEDRRKQWDAAIEDVKTGTTWTPFELDAGQSKDAMRSLKFGSLSSESTAVWKSMTDSYNQFDRKPRIKMGVSKDDIDWAPSIPSDQTPFETQLRILDSHIRQIGSHEAKALKELDMSRAIDDSQHNTCSSRLPPREPKTRMHLDKMQEMISKLVAQLLLEIKAFSPKLGAITQNGVPINDLNLQRKVLANRVDALQNGITELPAYAPTNCEAGYEEQRNLDHSITELLKNYGSESRYGDLLVAKICYNLLISRSPPTINTYNIMIEHFTRLQMHNPARIVIESFVQDSRFRPNETTIALMLKHFRTTRNVAGFSTTIRQMRGVESGLHIKRRALSTLNVPEVQQWARDTKVIHRNGQLYEKIPRNSEIFEELIHGSLEFFGLKRAILYLKAALREHCSITVKLFKQIIDQVIITKQDWAYIALLSAISSQWKCDPERHVGFMDSAEVRDMVHQVMKMCGQLVFVGVDDSLKKGLGRTAFNRMIRYMEFQETLDAVRGLVHKASTLQFQAVPVATGADQLGIHCEDTTGAITAALYDGLTRVHQRSYDCTVKGRPWMTMEEKIEVLFSLWRIGGSHEGSMKHRKPVNQIDSLLGVEEALSIKKPSDSEALLDKREERVEYQRKSSQRWVPAPYRDRPALQDTPHGVTLAIVAHQSHTHLHVNKMDHIVVTKTGLQSQLSHMKLQNTCVPVPFMQPRYATIGSSDHEELHAVM